MYPEIEKDLMQEGIQCTLYTVHWTLYRQMNNEFNKIWQYKYTKTFYYVKPLSYKFWGEKSQRNNSGAFSEEFSFLQLWDGWVWSLEGWAWGVGHTMNTLLLAVHHCINIKTSKHCLFCLRGIKSRPPFLTFQIYISLFHKYSRLMFYE